MKVHSINGIYPGWNRCELMLQHSSRETGMYWIDASVAFYSGRNRRRIIQLGPGAEGDAATVIKRLVSLGFQQVGRRLNQEWEHYSFVLKSEVTHRAD